MMDFQDLGLVVDWDHQLPPPAAKAVVENLPRTVISSSQAGENTNPFCYLRQDCQTHLFCQIRVVFPGQVGVRIWLRSGSWGGVSRAAQALLTGTPSSRSQVPSVSFGI